MTNSTSPKTFLLDTNGMLHDSACINNGLEHDIVTPSTVVEERDRCQKGHQSLNLHTRELLRALVPFCLALLLMATVAPASSPVLRYREQTGDDSFFFSWQADTTQDGTAVIVTQRQGEETFRSVTTPEGITSSWHYTKIPDTDVRVERVGHQLRFHGHIAGETIDKQEQIDDRPWFQPLSYSLRCMVARQEEQASFWTIRPDTLEVLTLKAERAGREQLLKEHGPALVANKVIIRLDGLMSALWSAEYWFRQSDNLFVQYRGTHGPPGTAETSISLVQQ